MNILILSAGTRNKLVQYCKKELEKINGIVIATDCSDIAPAIYDADKFYIVPKISESNYINILLEICIKEKINGVFSLIDPELSLLSQNKDKFEAIGVQCIVSPYEIVEMSFNKIEMYNFCKKNNIKTIKSYDNLQKFQKDKENGEIGFPVFIKPICGSCSVNIQKIKNEEVLQEIFNRYDNLMIQEYMSGQEIGCDVYIDSISGEVIDIFTKNKILMRAGETDKSISFKNEKLFKFIENFVKKAGYKWNIDIDVFEKDGNFYISEVNPRFGGGYPHAYECGCNFFKYIIKNLQGKVNEPQIGKYKENIIMMKYLELKTMENK